MSDAPVTVKHLNEWMAALKVIDPVMAKALTNEMKEPARKIANLAKDEAPSGPLISNYGSWKRGKDGFDLGYQRSDVQKGIMVTTGRKRISGSNVGASAALRIVSKSPIGVLYEKIGERGGNGVAWRKAEGGGKRPVNWPQSRVFVRAITGNYSPAPRLLIRIWRREKGITKSAAAAHRVAEMAVAEVEKRMK